MAENFEYGKKGIGADVEHGKDGGRTVWDGSKFQLFENDGTTPARVEVGDPSGPLDSVNFRTVEGLIDSIVWKDACRLATAATLSGWTSSGSGVGKTLTSPNDDVSNNDFDGVTSVVGDRILVKDGPTAVDNGVYTMTTLADGAAQNAIITRATDFDQDTNAAGADEVRPGNTVHIFEGSTLDGDRYTVLGTGPITVDTSAINWTLTGSIDSSDPQVRIVVIGTGATQNLGPLLPENARVQQVKLNVDTSYSGGTTIEIRDDGANIYMPTGDNSPAKGGAPNLFVTLNPGDVIVGGTRQLQAIIGGAPGAGSGTVVIEYKILP